MTREYAAVTSKEENDEGRGRLTITRARRASSRPAAFVDDASMWVMRLRRKAAYIWRKTRTWSAEEVAVRHQLEGVSLLLTFFQ